MENSAITLAEHYDGCGGGPMLVCAFWQHAELFRVGIRDENTYGLLS
jgi:hypothetical protein